MTHALLIIDIQQDYFAGGRHPLVGPDEAAAAAARLLAAWRERGEPVVHVQHVWDSPDAEFFQPGTPGIEIHPLVAPQADEPVVTKEHPNSFLSTDLAERLDAIAGGASGEPVEPAAPVELVVAGMMSSMCVDATVRAAADLGHTVTVAHDACAAPDLEFDGLVVPAAQVHAAFMAALGDGYATVSSADEIIAGD
ncbi:cysteine hydrolase [Agromyces endophyticus]|uniref:cysteine hydrolase family protein n=1 Tax=Agromyces sp. H17E-10 TaxID=2932244 RepID=UPI001FD484B9|nr:cysteine hydrolase family protein [Agromyces sp. H17E-10]UOQ90389.1 cysteine hydrolase [Agromyces sp. H17E-10]